MAIPRCGLVLPLVAGAMMYKSSEQCRPRRSHLIQCTASIQRSAEIGTPPIGDRWERERGVSDVSETELGIERHGKWGKRLCIGQIKHMHGKTDQSTTAKQATNDSNNNKEKGWFAATTIARQYIGRLRRLQREWNKRLVWSFQYVSQTLCHEQCESYRQHRWPTNEHL